MKIKFLSILSVFITFSFAFSQEKSFNSNFPVLEGPYLGQEAPGMTPELFAKDLIIGNRNRCFSLNGDHFFFVHAVINGDKETYTDYHMQIKNGVWTEPELLDLKLDMPVRYPFFHPNGEKFIFGSYINSEKEANGDMDICIADYRDGEFSNATILDANVNTSAAERHPTVSKDGTLYFYSEREDGEGGADIYYSEFVDGKYQPAKNIGAALNTVGNEYNPFIAPDGSYIMFNSYNRNGIVTNRHDIYISFKKEDGNWTEAVRAGDKINSPYSEWAAFVTADEKYLFFTSRRRSQGYEPDMYWVDAKIIDDLKREVLANSEIWINENIRLIHLKDSVYMHTTWVKENEGSKGYGSNGMIVIKNKRAVMVDTPVEAENTQLIFEYLKNSMGVTITKFIAGHYHPDNVGGLDYLKAQGVESIANYMTINTCKEIGMPVPEIPFTDSLIFDFNGLNIQCRYFGGGHTYDNITVYIPEKKILFGGCLIKSIHAERIGVVPNQSVLNDWDVTVKRIIESCKGNLIVIPGHGNYGNEELLYHTVELAIKKKNQ